MKVKTKKIGKPIELRDIDFETEVEVVADIVYNFENLYNRAFPHRDMIDRIENAILYNSRNDTQVYDEDGVEQGERVVLPHVYEQYHTYSANIWKSNFATYTDLVDVAGRDPESELHAPTQKSLLLETAKDMSLLIGFEEALRFRLIAGEMIAFLGWNTTTKQRKKKELIQTPVLDEVTGEPIIDETTGMPITQDEEDYIYEDVIEYDGPELSIIDPKDFVFDYYKRHDWLSCPKIYRQWTTLADILDDEVYEIDGETEEYLTSLVYGVEGFAHANTPDEFDRDSDEGVSGDMIELLHYWGDVRLSTGEILRNYVITIAARNRLIRLEPSPYPTCPIIYSAFYIDEETGRSISPLSTVIPMAQAATTMLNLQIAAVKLIINKPFLAPKGVIVGDIEVYPGKIIEYNAKGLQNTQLPTPLDFKDALIGMDFITAMEKEIESATGVTKYMVGALDDRTRTATETMQMQSGSGIRMSKETTMINMTFTIPIFQGIAELLANFKMGSTEFVRTPNQQEQFTPVNDVVRLGKYSYNYGDSQTAQEREAKLKKMVDIISVFANRPEVMAIVNFQELFRRILVGMNFENVELIIANDPLQQMLATIPPEFQPQIKEALAVYLQGILQYVNNMQNSMGGQTGDGQDPSGAAGGIGMDAGVVPTAPESNIREVAAGNAGGMQTA